MSFPLTSLSGDQWIEELHVPEAVVVTFGSTARQRRPEFRFLGSYHQCRDGIKVTGGACLILIKFARCCSPAIIIHFYPFI